MRKLRYATCGAKISYPSKKDALTKRNARLSGEGKGRPDLLRAYHCNSCNGWHLTSQELMNASE
jgi:hypothetical protein